MVYGARGYGDRAYGDSSLGGAGSTGGGGGGVDHPASIAFSASASFAAVGARVVSAAISFSAAATFAAAGGRTLSGKITFEARASFAVTPRIIGTEYRVVVTDVNGTRYAELENAVLGPLSWVLNGIGTFEFSLDVMDPKAVHVLAIAREVQVWRGNALLWWGPITHVQATETGLAVQCATFLWYFSRRYFGKADRDNLLENGGFEDGLAHWDLNSVPDAFGVTNPGYGQAFDVTVVESPTLVEQRAARVETGPDGHFNNVSQTVARTVVWDLGDLLTLVGWSYVPSASYAGLNFDANALSVSVLGGGIFNRGTTYFDPDGGGQDRWMRHEVVIHQPIGSTSILVQLGGVHGVTVWDEVNLVLMESLSTVTDQDMTAWVIREIIQYGQGRWVAFDHGKSDLNIDPVTPASGVMVTRTYQMADHANLLDSILEFTKIEGGCDVSEEFTPTNRYIVTHYPEKGVRRPDLPLELGKNIKSFTWSFDGNAAANQVLILGQGDGPDREEGGATSNSDFGGVTVEMVDSAPTGTGVERLDELARERLRLVKNPIVLELQTDPEDAENLVGYLRTGDRHPVWIDRNLVQVNEDYRIVQITLDPNADILTLTANLA